MELGRKEGRKERKKDRRNPTRHGNMPMERR
jgi:hypothetical protein